MHAGPRPPWGKPLTRPSDLHDAHIGSARASGFEPLAKLTVTVQGVTAPAGSDHLSDPPMVDAEYMALFDARFLEARRIVDPVEIAARFYVDEPLAMDGQVVPGLRFAFAHNVAVAARARLG